MSLSFPTCDDAWVKYSAFACLRSPVLPGIAWDRAWAWVACLLAASFFLDSNQLSLSIGCASLNSISVCLGLRLLGSLLPFVIFPLKLMCVFFSPPCLVVNTGSLVFVPCVFGWLWMQLHQLTCGSTAMGRGRPPAGHLQLVSVGPPSLSIDAFQLLYVHQSIYGGILLGLVRPFTWQWHVLPCFR